MNELVAQARALAPSLALHTDAHIRDRQLAPSVVDALHGGPWLRLLVPSALGGLAVTPATYVEILAALAEGDAATAWVVMTASTSTLLGGYLDPASARTIWDGGAAPLLAGVFAPGGKATLDGEHLRLSGRWPYASGCRHARWIAVGALTGSPAEHVVCVVPLDQPGVAIADTWDPIGLAGTGSHDVTIDDVRVPRAHAAAVFGRAAWPDEPLARVPLFGLLSLGVAGVGLGIARGALGRAAARLAADPKIASATLAAYAELAARLRAAAAYATTVGDRALAEAAAGPVGDVDRGDVRLAAAHLAHEAAAVTRAAFHLAGGAAIGRSSPLARALADVEVMLTHRMVADRVRPAAARALLGLGAARDL